MDTNILNKSLMSSDEILVLVGICRVSLPDNMGIFIFKVKCWFRNSI